MALDTQDQTQKINFTENAMIIRSMLLQYPMIQIQRTCRDFW